MADVSSSTLTSSTTTAPETVAFNSSFLQSATYDQSQFSLTVAFKSGHTLIYRYVFPQVWELWKQAPSKGSHYATQIKGKHQSISLRKPLFVSDIEKAKKAVKGNHANRH